MSDPDVLALISTFGINFVFLILFLREQMKVQKLQDEWLRYQTTVQNILLGMIPKPQNPTALPVDTEPLIPLTHAQKNEKPPK